MTVTGVEQLADFARRDAIARRIFPAWINAVSTAKWKSPADVLNTFGSADPLVRVASGRRVAVFNVRGNHYRVVAAIDYSRQSVRILKVMSHAEYGRDAWKDHL